jgi:putative intracellular protease/amidase
MKTSAMTSRGPADVRRLARGLSGIALAGVSVAGVGAAGVLVSMRAAFPRPPRSAAESWPPAKPVPNGRLAVAVVLGASGSVITDALGPYEVFARSPRFFVYTVSAGRPIAMLSGGLASVPDHSFEDVDTGSAPTPDLVVIPAVAAPNGNKEALLREWITRQADRGSADPQRVRRFRAAGRHRAA